MAKRKRKMASISMKSNKWLWKPEEVGKNKLSTGEETWQEGSINGDQLKTWKRQKHRKIYSKLKHRQRKAAKATTANKAYGKRNEKKEIQPAWHAAHSGRGKRGRNELSWNGGKHQ